MAAVRAAGSRARREGDRARGDEARDARGDHQFAHARRISLRPEVLADPRGGRSRSTFRSICIRRRRRKAMIGPLLDAGLDGAVFGFGVETGLPCAAHHRLGRVRPLPEAAVHPRAHGRGAALLDVPARLHVRRGAQVEALSVPAAAQARRLALSEEQFPHHQFGRGVGAGDQVHASRCSARTACSTRWTIPISVRRKRSRFSTRWTCRSRTKKKFFQTNAEKLFKI